MLSAHEKEVMPSVYELKLYKTSSGREPFTDFLHKLYEENNLTEAARIKAYLERLRMHGMEINRYYSNTIRKVSNEGIWELRPGGNRVFFFHFEGKRIVLLHAYRKHGQKAPPSEIKQAENERKDYLRRKTHGQKPQLR